VTVTSSDSRLGADGKVRRTNADKRRAVEIALREFPKLSSRQLAELFDVGDDMVNAQRRQLSESDSSAGARMGADGRVWRLPRGEPEAASGTGEEEAVSSPCLQNRQPFFTPLAHAAALSRPRCGPASQGMGERNSAQPPRSHAPMRARLVRVSCGSLGLRQPGAGRKRPWRPCPRRSDISARCSKTGLSSGRAAGPSLPAHIVPSAPPKR